MIPVVVTTYYAQGRTKMIIPDTGFKTAFNHLLYRISCNLQ